MQTSNLQLRARLKTPCIIKDDHGRVIYERTAGGYFCERKYTDSGKLIHFSDNFGNTLKTVLAKKVCEVIFCQF